MRRLHRHRHNRRRAAGLGQSLEFIQGIAGLFAGAIVLWVVYGITSPLLEDTAADAPGGLGGLQMNQWFNTGLDTILPLLFLGLFFLGMIALGIESRRY